MRDQVLVQAQASSTSLRRHGARAVGQDDRRNARSRPVRRPASTSTSAACRTAILSASATPTTRPACSADHACAGRRSAALPLTQYRDRRSERPGDRRRFFRRHGSVVSQLKPRLEHRHCSSRIPPARRCGCSTTARRTGPISTRSRRPDGNIAHRRHAPNCRSSSTAATVYRRDHVDRLAERRLCRPHHGQFRAARRSVAARGLSDRAVAPAGDATRPNFIYRPARQRELTFLAAAGIGTTARHLAARLAHFCSRCSASRARPRMPRAVSTGPGRGGQRAAATVQRRSGVNIDEEMAHLLSLQNAYAANARVLSTVKECSTP